MTVWLRPEQARAIIDHACSDAPNEACGLLLGRDGEVMHVIPARNVDEQPRTGFVVAPQDLFDALNRAEREGLSLLAAYHSHPAGSPVPSERDVAEAHYPDTVQIIVGLKSAQPEIAAWRIADGRLSRVELLIQSDRPLPSASEPERMSASQRVAIVAAGLIAVVIVLMTAFSLLPPPELPS